MARQRGTTAFLLFRNPLRQLRQKVGYWPRFSIDVGRIRNDPFSLALSRLTLAVARPAAASRRRGGTAADGAEPVLQPDHPQEAHPPTRGVLQRVPGGAADQHVVFGHTAWRWSSTSAQPLPAQQNNTSCWRSCAWRRICAPGYAPGCPARRASPRWGLLRCGRNDRQCGGGRALRHGDLPLGELAHGCLQSAVIHGRERQHVHNRRTVARRRRLCRGWRLPGSSPPRSPLFSAQIIWD